MDFLNSTQTKLQEAEEARYVHSSLDLCLCERALALAAVVVDKADVDLLVGSMLAAC